MANAPAAAAATVPRKKRDRTPHQQHAASRDHSRRWLDDFHSSEDVPPFFAWSRQRERRQRRRQRQQGQASSSSGGGEGRARGRASGTPLRADEEEEEEEEEEEAAARDSSRTTSRRRGGRGEVDVSENYLSEYQRSFIWPQEPEDPVEEEEEEEEEEGKEEERSVSSSSSAVFSSLSHGTYSGDEKAFYLSGSDESVASSPSLLSSLFHIERRGSEGGGVDEWDEEEGEWEVNEKGEAEYEEEEDKEEDKEEKEEGEEEEGLADLTWWEVLGESPPQESEKGGEQGRTGRKKGRRTRIRSRRRRSSSSSSGSSGRRGSAFPRNRVDHLWEIFSPPPPPSPPFSPHPPLSSISFLSKNKGRGMRGDVSQILIKERNPGADVWDVYMGSNGKLRRRPRWSVFGC